MELTHRFTVPTTLEHAWRSFNDLEALAPCFPGATLTSVDGDTFAGTVRIKFGPVSLTFDGDGRFTDRDTRTHQIMITASGADRRGHGRAEAKLTATFAEADGPSTAVEVRTDLSLSGRPAQFGQGVISDISDKLLGQFTDCISQRFAAGQVVAREVSSGSRRGSQAGPREESPAETRTDKATAPLTVPADSEPVATGVGPIGGGAQSGGASGVTGASSGAATPPITDSDPEPRLWVPHARPAEIDGLRTALPVLLKHYGPPVLAGVTFMSLVIGIVRRIRSR